MLVLVSLFFPLWTFAQSIVINEIAWMGAPVPGIEEKQWWRYEWLELYNNADAVGMLDGWTIGLYRGSELYFQIPLSGTVASHGYFLIGASDKISGVDINYSNLGGKFLNTGQKIVLSNAVGAVVDEVDATLGRSGSEESSGSMSWPAGDNKTKRTMERVGGVSETEALTGAWQTSKEPGGTPKAPNSAGVVQLSSVKDSLTELRMAKDEQEQTEKDLAGRSDSDESSDSKRSSSLQSFQSRVHIVNPITLLAGLLALGFSGVLLLAKRLLASRQARLPARQERRQVEHLLESESRSRRPERSRRT
jgi:hypothetical protein